MRQVNTFLAEVAMAALWMVMIVFLIVEGSPAECRTMYREWAEKRGTK